MSQAYEHIREMIHTISSRKRSDTDIVDESELKKRSLDIKKIKLIHYWSGDRT